MLARRRFLVGSAAVACWLAAGPAAAEGPLEVVVPSNAVGAVVAAEAGDAVAVKLDRSLAATQIRVDGAVVDVAGSIKLKSLFLDDPRNAPKLGASVRKALAAARPELKAQLEANHKSWTHSFARKILAWNTALATSKVRGKRVADTQGRAALLEWAGATTDAAGEKPPAGLARAPKDAEAATLESYVAYVEALVRSLQ